MKNIKIAMMLFAVLFIGIGASFYAAADLTSKTAVEESYNSEEANDYDSYEEEVEAGATNLEAEPLGEEVSSVERTRSDVYSYNETSGEDSEQIEYEYDENDNLVGTTCYKSDKVVDCDSLEDLDPDNTAYAKGDDFAYVATEVTDK